MVHDTKPVLELRNLVFKCARSARIPVKRVGFCCFKLGDELIEELGDFVHAIDVRKNWHTQTVIQQFCG